MYRRALTLGVASWRNSARLTVQLPIGRSYCPNTLQAWPGNLVLLVSLKLSTNCCSIWLAFSTKDVSRTAIAIWFRLGKTLL